MLDISREPPLTAIGEVVWLREDPSGDGYEVGIKFLNIYEDDYRALMKYLKDSIEKDPTIEAL